MSRTNFCLDFDSDLKWACQVRLKPSMVSSLLAAQERGENIQLQFSAANSAHVLTVGESKYNLTCRGEQSNDHTVCELDSEWAKGRAQEVGVVKMRGEVQSTFEEKAASVSNAKNTTCGNVGKRIREAAKPAQPVGANVSAAGMADTNVRMPALSVLSPPRTDASSPPAEIAPGENKGSRGPSPAPQRETPSPITDSDGAVIESAKLNAVAREAAKRAQLRNCVLACVAGNNWRVQKKITMAVQQYFREAKKNGSAPGESIVEGVVKEVTQSGKYGYFLKQKAREELINKVLPELSAAKPSTPPSDLAKAVKQAKKPKTSPKTQPIPASDSKAKRQKGPSDESAKETTAAVVKKHKGHNDEPMKDRTEAKAKRPKPFPDNNASGPSEPKPKKHKSLTAAPKASAGGPGTKAPRPEKQPARGPAHGSPDAQKPPPSASSMAAKASAHAQPKARSDARHAADVATPRATPPVRTPPAATPKPSAAPKARTAARPAAPPAAPAQPASARSTPASPADTPMETLPEAPPVRTVRQSSPAPPKVPAEVLMDQYPPKVSADVLEGIADDTPRPAPAWCEPADEGADAEAEMHCDAGAEPASPGSNESEPRHDSEMRGGGADGGEAAARRRTTRGQRAPNYCEDSDDDFAIDTTPVTRAVAPAAQAAHPAGAAPGAGPYGMAEADARFRHAAAEDEGAQAARDADMAQLRSSESPPTQFGEVAADKGGAAWPQLAEPPVPLRDSSWFREHAEAAGEMRMGRAVPALMQAQVPQAYETYRTLAAEVQGQMEAMEAITGLGDSKPLSAEQERALHEFQVNQQYWEDAYMTLTALHERLGQARLQGVH